MASKAAAVIHYAQLAIVLIIALAACAAKEMKHFRELRHSCLQSRQRAADYLGVSVR